MGEDRLPDDMLLSEAQVRDIIEQAALVEPRTGGTTLAELREIAHELDIDPLAFDRALDQVVGLPLSGRPIRSWIKRKVTRLGRFLSRFLPERGRIVTGGILGAMAGSLNAFLAGVGVNAHYPIAVVMIGFTLMNLLSRRLDKQFGRFLAETVTTWGLYAGLWALTYGGFTFNLVMWCIQWTSLAGIAGWFLVRDPSGGGDDQLLLSESTGSLPPELPPAVDGEPDPRRDVFRWAAALRLSY